MNHSAIRLSLLSLLTLAATCQEPAANAKKTFVLEPGEIRLNDLIDRCASLLGWNILVRNEEISAAGGGEATIRLQNRLTTDVQGCEDFLSNMLYRGCCVLTALDESKQLYEIISATGPRQREITNRAQSRTPAQVLARPALKVPVLTVVELKHINATIATNALRPFFASTGSAAGGSQLTLGNVGNNPAVLLCGMNDQVAAAIRLVQTCDVPPPPEAAPPSKLTERIDAIERRLQALEQKLTPQQPPQGR